MRQTPVTELQNLNGLRGLFVLMVCYHHASMLHWFRFTLNEIGFIGVMFFFTLSGFLMTYHYTPGRLSPRYWAAYLIRRFFRIYPVLGTSVLLTWLAGGADVFAQHIPFSSDMAIAALKLQVRRHWVFWSLSPEIKFYLVFPLIALAWQLAPVREESKLVVLGVVWLYLLQNTFVMHNGMLALRPFLPFFVGGMFAAMFYRLNEQHGWLRRSDWNFVAVFSLGLTLLVMLPQFRFGIWPGPVLGHRHNTWASFRAYSVLSAVLVGACAKSDSVRFVLSNRVALFFGKISFGLYLVHLQVYFLVRRLGFAYPGAFVFSFLMAALLATVLHWLVERPGIQCGRFLAEKIADKGRAMKPALCAVTPSFRKRLVKRFVRPAGWFQPRG